MQYINIIVIKDVIILEKVKKKLLKDLIDIITLIKMI